MKLTNLKPNGCHTHLVIKFEDLIRYVNSTFKLAMLDNDLADIAAGREKDGKRPVNQYIIINTDEPYIDEIKAVLKKHGHWDEEAD